MRKLYLIINSICIQVNLGNVRGTFFLWFLQGLITAGYKTIKLQNAVFMRDGGEGGSGNGGG